MEEKGKDEYTLIEVKVYIIYMERINQEIGGSVTNMKRIKQINSGGFKIFWHIQGKSFVFVLFYPYIH